MISSFTGEYAFLSNFCQAPFEVALPHGWRSGALVTKVPDVEHAFQAWKAADQAQAAWVLEAPTAKEAKRRGRQVTPQSNWEEIKREVMLTLVLAKFSQHPELREKLAATGDDVLMEGNTWGDEYWGMTRHGSVWVGQNYLGQILMAVRMVLC